MKKFLYVILFVIIIIPISIFAYEQRLKENIVSYNRTFWQQIEYQQFEYANYVPDVKALIDTTINNNKGKKQVSILYENENYTTTGELMKLSNKVDLETEYFIKDIEFQGSNYIFIKNNMYDINNNGYIKSLTLTTYEKILKSYEGNQKNKETIIDFIYMALDFPMNYSKTKIIYKDNDKSIKINMDQKIQDTEIWKEIESYRNRKNTYDLEIKKENDEYYITITKN